MNIYFTAVVTVRVTSLLITVSSLTFEVDCACARMWAAKLQESEPTQISKIFHFHPQTTEMR